MAKEYIEIQNLKDDISSLDVTVGGKSILNDDAKSSVLRVIDEQPTADVQEVVKCKDCIFIYTDDCAMCYRSDSGEQYSWNNLTDFCSWGKKKESEQK